MKKEKGILIIATENPYYGRMALNLCVSIKAVEDFPVAIAISGASLSHLSEKQKSVFDEIIVTTQTKGVGAKVKMYDLSPFEKTLYIDADNIWLPMRKPSDFFKGLEGVEFAIPIEGKISLNTGVNHLRENYTMWGDFTQIMTAYELKELYQMRTEIIYFIRSEKMENFFEMVKTIYENPKTETVEFGGSVPDEYAFNIAAAITETLPYRENWQPAYWRALKLGERIPTLADLYTDYVVLSTGGLRQRPEIERIYNNIAAAAHKKMRMQYLFKLQPKRMHVKERRFF